MLYNAGTYNDINHTKSSSCVSSPCHVVMDRWVSRTFWKIKA